MPHIFISHSTKDNEFTRKLADDLNKADFDTWVDLEGINPGERWLHSIQKAIEKCGAAVIIMSRAARDSEWVERETLLAMDLKKPIHIALIEDMPMPLHLINRQFTDFRTDYDTALKRLTDALSEQDFSAAPRKVPEKLSPLPDTDNFFEYMKQLPGGESNALIARELYQWGKKNADKVEFGGRITPGFHVKQQIGEDELTIFSVWAYRRRPAVQVQFSYLADYAPYDNAKMRKSTMESLNRLMDEYKLMGDQANRRPTLPLQKSLNTAEKLETFSQIMQEIIDNLNSV